MIKALSDNIQALIKIRGIQIGKLEKQLGVSAGYFSRVRRGMSISSEVLYKLSKAVDVSMDDLCSKGYNNRLIKEDRPQGKWIDHSEDYGYVECPICEHLTNCEGDVDELHYCWYCGAKLEKGGKENEDS